MKCPYNAMFKGLESRPPRGGRGLKLYASENDPEYRGRPPRGGRGLKWRRGCCPPCCRWSPPSRGAWIEILPRLVGLL